MGLSEGGGSYGAQNGRAKRSGGQWTKRSVGQWDKGGATGRCEAMRKSRGTV